MLARSAKRKGLFFAVCYLAYMAVYTARINLSMAAPALKQMSILTGAQLGILGSAFSVVYAVGRLINGTLSDRVRPSTMIFSGLLITGLSNLAFSIRQPFYGLFVFWVINAYGQSMLWSSLLCVMSGIFDVQAAKKANSYLVTSVASGNIAAILLSSFLLSRFDACWAFIVPGISSIAMGGVCLFVLGGVGIKCSMPVHEEPEKDVPASFAELNRENPLTAALIPTLCHGAIKDNVTLWMSVIAVERCGIDLKQTAGFVLLIPTIGLLGRLLYPAFYRVCKNREHVLSCYAFAVCSIAAVALLLLELTPFGVMLALGVLYAASSMINTSMVSVYPTRFTSCGRLAAVSGLMDFATYLGAGGASVIYGQLADHCGYEPMFGSWVAVSAVSIAVLVYLQRRTQQTPPRK